MAERFYVRDLPLTTGALIELGEEESHHLLKVMRARVGQAVQVFGGGSAFEGELHSAEGKRARIFVGNEMVPPAPPAFLMTFAIPWLKGGRSESVIQKLTELGADRIIIYSARREVARLEGDKLDRLCRTAIEACKQCERADPPEVLMAKDLSSALERRELPRERRLVLAERHGSGLRLSQAVARLLPSSENIAGRPGGEILVASGPEGGFTPEELEGAETLALRVSLGPRILRAETAPVAAAAAILAAGGDL